MATICILPQNGLHFAAKWVAFCRKMDCVLPQNGKCFAAKWKMFWPKMERVLGQNGRRFGPKQEMIWAKTPLGFRSCVLQKPYFTVACRPFLV